MNRPTGTHRSPGPAALLHQPADRDPADAGAWSELEAALMGEDRAAAQQALDQAIGRLDALETGLRQRLQAGLPPAEFGPVSALAAACVAARETVVAAAARLAAPR